MTIWGLNNFYTQSFCPQWSGVNSYAFFPSFSSIPSSIFTFGTPRYSVSDYNIFGFTPPTNFSYIPQLDNPFNNSYMGLINFLPQFTMPQFLTSNLNFGRTNSSDNIFGFLTSSRISNTSQTTTQTGGTTNRSSSSSSSSSSISRQTTSSTSSNSAVTNAINVARSQIGVRENGDSNNSAQVNEYRNGVQNGTPWCASFVSWCYGRGQNSTNGRTFGYSSSSQQIKAQAEQAGVYSKVNSGYKPQAGDLMVLRYSDGSGHIGIIEKVNSDGTFYVIEGNTSNQVKRIRRSMNTEKLDGFVRMNEWLTA